MVITIRWRFITVLIVGFSTYLPESWGIMSFHPIEDMLDEELSI